MSSKSSTKGLNIEISSDSSQNSPGEYEYYGPVKERNHYKLIGNKTFITKTKLNKNNLRKHIWYDQDGEIKTVVESYV